MFFFTPRYLKEAKHYLHGARKFLHYKEDILKPGDRERVEEEITALKLAMRARSREGVAKSTTAMEELIGSLIPPLKDAAWRDNIEVFLVAIVVAAGVRAYFLQPFKIPTGSMQPTLFGIVGVPLATPPPNFAKRTLDFLWLGRNYIDVIAKEDDEVVELHEHTHFNFFTFTDIVCQKNTYTVFAPARQLQTDFAVTAGKLLKASEPIARGYIDTGDQVFVDKLRYNFESPGLGDVFVFKTTGIQRIEAGIPAGMGSQHYIKRLAGLPGQTLRIVPPTLTINGLIPKQFVFQRVMSVKDGYQGYSNGMNYLSNPDDSFTVKPGKYFALGDNSYNSSDSRYWGEVPERNVAGRGLFVYWPFSKRWGLIR